MSHSVGNGPVNGFFYDQVKYWDNEKVPLCIGTKINTILSYHECIEDYKLVEAGMYWH